MLKGEPPAKRRKTVTRVVNYLGSHNRFKAHGARIGYTELLGVGLPVKRLNDDVELCDRVMAIYMALSHTFNGTGAYKIWENSDGDCHLRAIQQVQIMMPGAQPVAAVDHRARRAPTTLADADASESALQ